MKLTIRKTWKERTILNEDDYVVILDGKKDLARIMQTTRSDYRKVWSWSIYGFIHPHLGGSCDTFDEARAETKTEVLRLLAANTPIMPGPPEWIPGSAFLESIIERQISPK